MTRLAMGNLRTVAAPASVVFQNVHITRQCVGVTAATERDCVCLVMLAYLVPPLNTHCVSSLILLYHSCVDLSRGNLRNLRQTWGGTVKDLPVGHYRASKVCLG